MQKLSQEQAYIIADDLLNTPFTLDETTGLSTKESPSPDNYRFSMKREGLTVNVNVVNNRPALSIFIQDPDGKSIQVNQQITPGQPFDSVHQKSVIRASEVAALDNRTFD